MTTTGWRTERMTRSVVLPRARRPARPHPRVVRTTTPALRVRAAFSMAMAGILYGAGAGLYQPALMALLSAAEVSEGRLRSGRRAGFRSHHRPAHGSRIS